MMGRLLMFTGLLATLMLPCVLSKHSDDKDKTTGSVMNLCGKKQTLLITEAFSKNTGSRCYRNCTRKDGNDSRSVCSLHDGKCRSDFTIGQLRRIYEAVRYNDTQQLSELDTELGGRGKYSISYRCFSFSDVRKNMIDPCKWTNSEQSNSGNNKPLAIFYLNNNGTCKATCNITLSEKKKTLKWEQQYLLREENTTNNDVSYVSNEKSPVDTSPFLNRQRFREREKKFKTDVLGIRLIFDIEKEQKVARFWFRLTNVDYHTSCALGIPDKPTTAATTTTTTATTTTATTPTPTTTTNATTTTTTTTATTTTTETTTANHTSAPSTNPPNSPDSQGSDTDGVSTRIYIGVTVAIIVSIAVVVTLVIKRKRRKEYTLNHEVSHLMSVPLIDPDDFNPSDAENPFDPYENQEPTWNRPATGNGIGTGNASETSLLGGHVTGSGGSDDRQYGSLHHDGGNRRRRDGDDDYHHLIVNGADGGYESFQRGSEREVVIDNEYDHMFVGGNGDTRE